MDDARMSTSDGENHLLSFGEFCAMHLMAWCNELWPDPETLPEAKTVYAPLKDLAKIPPIWALHLGLLGDYPSKISSNDIKNPLGEGAKPLPFDLSNANKVLNYFVAKDSKPAGGYDRLDVYTKDVRITKDFMAGARRGGGGARPPPPPTYLT